MSSEDKTERHVKGIEKDVERLDQAANLLRSHGDGAFAFTDAEEEDYFEDVNQIVSSIEAVKLKMQKKAVSLKRS